MHHGNCHKAYDLGKSERATYPLHTGEYKLREGAERLKSILRGLDEVQHYIARGDRHWWASGCCSSDKHIWLRRLPPTIAYRLGYEALPGLLALPADGASVAVVHSLRPKIEARCEDLVDKLELARIIMSRNIGLEYYRLRNGDSTLKPLIEEAIGIFDMALSPLGATLHSRGTVRNSSAYSS